MMQYYRVWSDRNDRKDADLVYADSHEDAASEGMQSTAYSDYDYWEVLKDNGDSVCLYVEDEQGCMKRIKVELEWEPTFTGEEVKS